jgi:hypothetical protein
MDHFNIWVFLGLTVVLFGGCAFMMGQAIADTWRPMWQNIPYGFILAGGNHFLDAALFEGSWTSVGHYLLDAAVLIAIALFAYRVVLARKMTRQYPWLYEPAGLLGWKEKKSSAN